jgi:hypothetical protein
MKETSSYWLRSCRLRRSDSGFGVRGRARWAIHDRNKFILLIQDLKDLIDGLNAITPNTTSRHKRMVQRGLESLCDPEALELVREAMEDDYPGMIYLFYYPSALWWNAYISHSSNYGIDQNCLRLHPLLWEDAQSAHLEMRVSQTGSMAWTLIRCWRYP